MANHRIDVPGRYDYPPVLFTRWRLTINKCHSKGKSAYKEKHIKVCDEWRGEDGFLNFASWAVSHGFSPDLVIDRIDTFGDYSPENCRWVTKKENNRNRRDTVFIQTNDGEIPLVEFCEKKYGDKIPSHTSRYRMIYQRIKSGKPYDDILSTDQAGETGRG